MSYVNVLSKSRLKVNGSKFVLFTLVSSNKARSRTITSNTITLLGSNGGLKTIHVCLGNY